MTIRLPGELVPDSPTTATPADVERMRELVDELAKLDYRSSWEHPHLNLNFGEHQYRIPPPQVDPLLVERQLITYITNGTTISELETYVDKKRVAKKAEEEENTRKAVKAQWEANEQELLSRILQLEEFVKFAAEHKDGPHFSDGTFSSYLPSSIDRSLTNWKYFKANIEARLKHLDEWEAVKKDDAS